MNGLSLLLLIALAIGVLVAYRAGVSRGARDARAAASLAALASDPQIKAARDGIVDDNAPRPADAAVDERRAANARAHAPGIAGVPAAPPADAAARLAQAAAFADDRHALFRELADARAETARYRQLVIDLENDAPPPLLDSPAAPDDLKLIVGIGPVLERMLQQLGVSRYKQIARWSERDIDHFDARLPEFPGRIRRDGWVTQARSLHQSKYGEALPPRDRA